MKKKLTLIAISFCFIASAIQAQTASIKGSVADTSINQALHFATITLLRKADSVLVDFARTDAKGNFEIKNIPAGKYVLLVSYPNYAELADELDLKPNEQLDKKTIALITKAKVLEEVIVKQKVSAIRIKGDTTEYLADSFKVGPNANVQELLKKLPGMQVNSKGEITAQGQKVEKVLVDGEEFFSDDPAVVIKNLQADAVKKVQLYDKKSDEATFTGVDDGVKTKTINLELKEDKKKGYFGKLEAGSDFDNYRTAKALFNKFKGKQKISGFLTHDNINYEALNWEETNKYSSSDATFSVNDDGGISGYWESDGFTDYEGLPQSTSGGLLYNNKWNKDKQIVNSSYQYNNQKVQGAISAFTQNILPDTSFINNTQQTFSNNKIRHKIKALYEWQIDSTSSLKVTATGSKLKREANNFYAGQSLSEENILINNTKRTTTNKETVDNFSGTLFWRKRFKKAGRTISINSGFIKNNTDGSGFLNATNLFYNKGGVLIRDQILDQKKINLISGEIFNFKIGYTEPLSKTIKLSLNYGYQYGSTDANRQTFDKPFNSADYSKLNDTLSNHFLYKTNNHEGKITVQWKTKKTNLSIGSGIGTTQLKQTELNKNVTRSINFINYLPLLRFTYTPKNQTNFEFNYNGKTENPTLQQINPIIDNIDPININIGNPNLKQSFRHEVSFLFRQYKIMKSKNVYLSTNLSVTDNDITYANYIDTLGRRINQAINISGNYNFNIWSSYGFEIAKSLGINFSFSPSFSRYINVVNGQRNVTNSKNIRLGFGINYYPDKWLNFYSSFNATKNFSTSSINENFENKYWSFGNWTDVNMKLPKKFFLSIEGSFRVYQQNNSFANRRNVYFFNASLRKTFLKSDAMEVKLSVNDIFNQNQGVQRSIESNFIQETVTQRVQRYWLLTFSWNFNKNGKLSN